MELRLKRALKFNRLLAVTMGTPLASSAFLSMILMVGVAGNMVNLVLSVIIGTAITVLAALTYGELVSIYPSAAGNRIFLKKPLGDTIAIAMSLMWVFVILAAAGVESYVLGNVLYYLTGFMNPFLWSVLALVIIVLVNIMGVELSGNFQTIVTYSVVIVLVLVSIFALITPAKNAVSMGPFDPVATLTATAIGVYLFLGFGRVTTLGEEAVDYERSIPRALPLAVFLLGIVFVLVSMAIFRDVPYASLQNTAIPQILLGQYLIPNRSLAILIAIVSVVMSFSAFNAGILGTSRLVYALGREGLLPRFFGVIERRHFTPYLALVFLLIVVLTFLALVYETGNYAVPLYVAAGFDSFMYAAVAYSAFWHLRKLKAEEIPFRVFAGKFLFPLTTVIFFSLGILLLLSVSVVVTLVTVISMFLILFYIMGRRMYLSRSGSDRPS